MGGLAPLFAEEVSRFRGSDTIGYATEIGLETFHKSSVETEKQQKQKKGDTSMSIWRVYQ